MNAKQNLVIAGRSYGKTKSYTALVERDLTRYIIEQAALTFRLQLWADAVYGRDWDGVDAAWDEMVQSVLDKPEDGEE